MNEQIPVIIKTAVCEKIYNPEILLSQLDMNELVEISVVVDGSVFTEF